MRWLSDLPEFDRLEYTFPDGRRTTMPPGLYQRAYADANASFHRYQIRTAMAGLVLLMVAAVASSVRRGWSG